MQVCKIKEQDREEFDLLGPPHPGEIVREELLLRLRLSRKALALQLGVSYSTVLRLCKERRRITSDLAVALARVSGTQALFWLVLQAHHDAWVAQRAADAEAQAQRDASRRLPPERFSPGPLARFTDTRQTAAARAA